MAGKDVKLHLKNLSLSIEISLCAVQAEVAFEFMGACQHKKLRGAQRTHMYNQFAEYSVVAYRPGAS